MFFSFLFQKIFILHFWKNSFAEYRNLCWWYFFLISSFLQIRLVISEFPGSVVWSLPLIWGKICHCFKYLFSFLCFFYWYYHVYICYTFCNCPKCIVFFSVFAYFSNIGVEVCPLFSSLLWIQEELLLFQSVQLLSCCQDGVVTLSF